METTDISAADADGSVGHVFRRGLSLIAVYIRCHPKPFIVAVTGAALYAVTTVATSVVYGRITDHVITPAFDPDAGVTSSAVWAGVLAVVGVAILRALGIVGRRFFAGMFTARNQATLRRRVLEVYQQVPLAYHRAHPTGELLAHAEADVMAATDLLHPLPYSVAVLVIVVVSAVALVLTDPILAVVGLVMIPVLAVLNLTFTRKLEPLARASQEQIGEVSSTAHESFDGALVVKTLGLEDVEVRRFGHEAEILRARRVAMGRVRATYGPAIDSIPSLATIVLLAVGTWRLSTGDVTPGVLVQFASLFSLLTAPLRVISYLFFDFPQSLVAYARIRGVLEEPIPPKVTGTVTTLPAGPLGVRLDGVSFGYGDQQVLHDVSFEVPPGGTVALVGATGVGKSTLTQLLVRLADPDVGTLAIGEVDLRSVDPVGLRDDVAVVFQESFLFATSVLDNISLGAGFERADIERAARLAQAHRFITQLPDGYDTIMGERGVTLSGGQRQRVALARALVRRPRVLILDDATSAVDPTVEAEILGALRRELETTLVVVAYRTATISLADRVVFLVDGAVRATGTHAELLASEPAYEAMVRAYEQAATASELAGEMTGSGTEVHS
ncbi:MAG: ABC transporter ATP-binding protein [Ilumatobacteraceae bacterium]